MTAQLKKIAAFVGAIAGIAALVYGVGEYVFHGGQWFAVAEQAHAQTAENTETLKQLVEFQIQLTEREKAKLELEKLEAEQKRKQLEYIKRMCQEGKLTDATECAKADVTPTPERRSP